MTVEGDATVVVVALGSDGGVTKTSTCAFLDRDGKTTATDCVLIRVDRRSSVLKTHQSVDAVRRTPRVKLSLQ